MQEVNLFFNIFVERRPDFKQSESHRFIEWYTIKWQSTENPVDQQANHQSQLMSQIESVFVDPVRDQVLGLERQKELLEAYFENKNCFIYEYLPTQFVQRIDSGLQCLQLLNSEIKWALNWKRIVWLPKETTPSQIQQVQKDLINPIEARLWPKPTQLEIQLAPEDLAVIHQYLKTPNRAELKILETFWSDHCRHTSFHSHAENIQFVDAPQAEKAYQEFLKLRKKSGPPTLMELATLSAKLFVKPDVDVSEEVNACGFRIGDQLILFKNETHNHPTEIEPYGGASTCLGGAIRDPLSGRAYVYQGMRVSGGGEPHEVLPGRLPQHQIIEGAALGFSSYGNQIGVPTGLVQEFSGYLAKRLEVGAVIGAVPYAELRREPPAPGDTVLLIGGRTGRDGIGGATGSSRSEINMDKASSEVQKGNAPEERKLQRLFRNTEFRKLVKRCNDFGAGGVAVAVGELADGIEIDLHHIPTKTSDLAPIEIILSESQERMAVVVEAKDIKRAIELAKQENLEATQIARVTHAEGDSAQVIFKWHGEVVAQLPRALLNTNGAPRAYQAKVNGQGSGQGSAQGSGLITGQSSWQEKLEKYSSQEGLKSLFDFNVGGLAVFSPMGGVYQKTPLQFMVSQIPGLRDSGEIGTCMSFGFAPELADPFQSGQMAVVENVARQVSAGVELDSIRLSLQEYFAKPTTAEKWGLAWAGMLGAFDSLRQLALPAIGGKDSMSGSYREWDVPPTVIAFSAAPIRLDVALSSELKDPSGLKNHPSYLYWIQGLKGQDFQNFRNQANSIHLNILNQKIVAAASIGLDGLALTLLKMAFGNQVSFEIQCQEDLGLSRYGDWVVQSTEKLDFGILLGTTNAASSSHIGGSTSPSAIINGEQFSLDELLARHEKNYRVFVPPKPFQKQIEMSGRILDPISAPISAQKQDIRLVGIGASPSRTSFSKPQVLLPIFPGTNCEDETSYQFEKAGARVKSRVICNLTSQAIQESVQEIARSLKESQILMLAGGFSAGDEPDGSGRFISQFFRNQRLKDEVHEFLQRGGLILGICNGFQALVKLGLVPYGEIRDFHQIEVTLTSNVGMRHLARYVDTQVTSKLSPWLSQTNIDDVHRLPISHGEGRVYFSNPELLKELWTKGQVATRYVKNPNGSAFDIEAMSSPDGRILGKMAHSERVGKHVCRNVGGNWNQNLFQAGVRYYEI